MGMYSVLGVDNSSNLQTYALAICIVQDQNTPSPKGEPKNIETMARGLLPLERIETRAAFEVIPYMQLYLKTKVLQDSGSYRILSTQEILTVAKHAMALLQVVFKPYSARLKSFSATQLQELGGRIAGVCLCDSEVSVLTGAGIEFTALLQLYYQGMVLNKLESIKTFSGMVRDENRPIFYQYTFPSIYQMDELVSKVMGPVLVSKIPSGIPKDREKVFEDAALDVALNVRSNLQIKIQLGQSFCALMSPEDVQAIGEHVLNKVTAIFRSYAATFAAFSAEQIQELSARIAGVYLRDSVVNAVTGNGIYFTGLSNLYYKGTRSNKFESFKMLSGIIGKDQSKALFYRAVYPSLQEIDAVVLGVIGPVG